MSSSNITKYCACEEKWFSSLIPVTYETSFTMRWSNKCHCPTSPNTAPATKNDRPKCERNLLKTNETSFAMRGRSDRDPSMKTSVRNPPRKRGYFSRSSRAFFVRKNNISRSGYHSKFHRTLRLPWNVTVELHQKLRLPRETNLMMDPCHVWNAICNARSNSCHPPTSPNTASATKSDCHDSSSWHMKHHLQCEEQQVSPSNITKYCTCHEKWLSWTWRFYYLTLVLLYSMTLELLDSTIAWLFYYLTLPLLDSSITWLFYDLTLLLLDSTITWLFYYSTWLYYCLTLLLLDSSSTWLYYSLTLLLLDSSIAWLFYYLTLLLLDSSITRLFYYFTLLLLDSSITWL